MARTDAEKYCNLHSSPATRSCGFQLIINWILCAFRGNMRLPKGKADQQEDTKISRKTENQVAEMKKQTIGVEVEMNSITREKAAKIAAEFFGTERYRNTADRNGYCA